MSYSYAYNGMGDRLQQTVDAVTTEYTLDLNTGLTQVLTDGTDTYLYGLGRIGEFDGTDWTYPLADALGSVRQLTDSSGAPVMAQNYAPYGDVLTTYGAETSNYGFAGEWTDGTGLQHLRARYLNTGIGRFISRDTWGGDYNRPLSLNRWGYVEGNPVNLTDPSGHNPIDDWIEKFMEKLFQDTLECYENNDLDCVWRNYYTLAIGGQFRGTLIASRHMANFLLKRGDIQYGYISNPRSPNGSVYSVNPIKNTKTIRELLPAVDINLLEKIHGEAYLKYTYGIDFNHVTTKNFQPEFSEKDLWYAFGTISRFWSEADFRVIGCEKLVVYNRTYNFYDAYDWHEGLAAGGNVQGVKKFRDEWAAALHDNNLAKEYEIFGW